MRNLVWIVALLGTVLLRAPAFGAGPTCALLDPEKAPQTALLEAKLLADDSATWVERANIDKVLKEQKLQAMFSPRGVGERVQLGKLLKADVLVMVRRVKGVGEPTLEIVVSETAGGLRLLVRAVPVTKDTDADVANLLAAVRDGLRKQGEKITDVVAVPPFVSRNLESNYDHLKAAFAKLTEAEALDRKGVVVVELEEAEAMAKELAVATPGAKLERPAPVYLLGEYRHEGKGKDQTVAIKLRAERAGKVVGNPKTITGKPADAPNAIREWSAGVLDGLAKDDKPRPPADPKAEATVLVKRAEEFRRLGEWAEAAGLIEAALLLDTARVELHADMLAILEKYVDVVWVFGGQEGERDRRAMRAFIRGLEHLEAFVDKGGDLSRYGHPAGFGLTFHFLRTHKPFHIGPKALPESRAAMEEARRAQQEVLVRLIPAVAKQGKKEEDNLIRGAVLYLSEKEKYALLEKIVRQLHDLPDSAEREFRYCYASFYSHHNSPEYRAFLDRLAADKDEKLRAVGERLKKRLAQEQAEPLQPRDKPPGADPNAPRYVTLQPITLAFDPADGEGLNEKLFDIVPAGPDVDVLTADGAVFVMKQKGKPKRIWGPEKGAYMLSLSFDGKYVWGAADGSRADTILLVIDPKAEKVWEVTGKHGLPRLIPEEGKLPDGDTHLRVAPLGPGRVCLAGYFDRRGWIGVATFDPATGPAVKVTQDARRVGDSIKDDPGQGPEVAFTPNYLFTVPGQPDANKRPTQRVVLGRGGFPGHGFSLPLLFDPDRPANDPRAIEWDSLLQPHAIAASGDGSLYYAYRMPYAGRDARQILRVPFPGGKREETGGFIPHSAELCLRFQEGKLNVVVARQWAEQSKRGEPGKFTSKWEWWQYDPATKKARILSDDVPPVQHLATSAHYGSVAVGGGVRGAAKASLYSAVIENPGANYDFNPIVKPSTPSAAELKLRWTAPLEANQAIFQFHFISDADSILFGNPFGAFGAVNATTGESKTQSFSTPPKSVQDFYPLGAARFGTRSRDETRIRLWDAKTGKADGVIELPELPAAKLPEGNGVHAQLSPDGKFLAAARTGASHKPFPCAFRLINVATGKPVMSFDWAGGSVQFTADSSRVLLAEYGGKFRWFKLPSGEADGGWEFTEPDGTGIHHRVLGVSGDGRVIAYFGPRNTRQDFAVYTLNGKTGEVLRRFKREYSPRPGMISGDGRFIVVSRPSAPGRITFEVYPTTEAPAIGQATVPFQRSIPYPRLSQDGRLLLVQDQGAAKLYAYEVPQPAAPPK